MSTFSLDLAFSSAILHEGSPIYALGYGWATGKSLFDINEKMDGGSDVLFAVYDAAATPGTLTKIEVDFSNDGYPFTTGENPIIVDSPTPLEGGMLRSYGTNVQGAAGWQIGAYTLIPSTDHEQVFDFTVTLTVQPANGQQISFQVDPRIIVKGTN